MVENCCHDCGRRPKCLLAKPAIFGRGVCTLVAGSKECKDTQASGWCRICRRWTRISKKEKRDDQQALF